jgi:hypothetical protein
MTFPDAAHSTPVHKFPGISCHFALTLAFTLPLLLHITHAEHAKPVDNRQQKARHVTSSHAKRLEAQTAKQHPHAAPNAQETPAAAEEFDPSRATIQAVKVDPERVEVHLAATQARGSNPATPKVSVHAVVQSSGGRCPKGLYLLDDVCVACEDYRLPSDCNGCKPPEQCRK